GDGKLEVVATGAAAVVAHARLTVVRRAVRTPVVSQQRGGLRIAHQDDLTAVAAVSAVGAREGLELFPFHRDAPVAAMPRAQVQGHVVHEGCHGRDPFLSCRAVAFHTTAETRKGEPKLAPTFKEYVSAKKQPPRC